jgi:heme-degrading monooxygenase HmoA
MIGLSKKTKNRYSIQSIIKGKIVPNYSITEKEKKTMPHMLVRHKVEDYAKWKPIYDQHASTRRASGSKGAHLFRNVDNPNEIIILFEWDDLSKARNFARSEDLIKTMKKAGVIGKPDIYFLDDIESTSA